MGKRVQSRTRGNCAPGLGIDFYRHFKTVLCFVSTKPIELDFLAQRKQFLLQPGDTTWAAWPRSSQSPSSSELRILQTPDPESEEWHPENIKDIDIMIFILMAGNVKVLNSVQLLIKIFQFSMLRLC